MSTDTGNSNNRSSIRGKFARSLYVGMMTSVSAPIKSPEISM
jgi:hypothetical protein